MYVAQRCAASDSSALRHCRADKLSRLFNLSGNVTPCINGFSAALAVRQVGASAALSKAPGTCRLTGSNQLALPCMHRTTSVQQEQVRNSSLPPPVCCLLLTRSCLASGRTGSSTSTTTSVLGSSLRRVQVGASCAYCG